MTPLIHLHGALGAALQFQPLIHELREFANFSFDFEGHGKAQQTLRDFRIEHFAENLRNFIEHHRLAPARIVGYSMGGYVALWLAAHQPMLVHSVITLGTKFAWSPQGAAHEIKFLDAEKMLSKVPAFAAELELRHAHTDWRTVVEKTTEMMRDLGEQPRLDAEMSSKIQCRVRVGVGDRDAMVTLEETRDAFKAIPRSEMYVLPGTEHPLERVNVLRWATVIRDFFISSTGK